MQHPEIAPLLSGLEQAYERRAWHGPTLRGSLRGLTARQAAWRPAPGRHNIWEVVVHAAYWKYVVRRRLLGEKRGSFAIAGSNWFARPASDIAREWREDLELLEREHRSLCRAVATLSLRGLHKRSMPNGFSWFDTVLGVAFHDIYHAGQIQLLKRLQKPRR